MHKSTEALVQRVFSIPSYSLFSERTKQNIKHALFDYLVCCQAAVRYDMHFEKVWNTQIYPGGTSGTTTVFGTGKKVHPYDACLINGYAAHALDLDDVHSDIRGHPSAVILSLLFSLVDEKKKTERFFEAYVIGIEVMSYFAKLLGKEHYEKGFHTTATAGIYGAVSAGAYYLHYTEDEAAKAIDLTISQVSGSRSHFGSLIKPLHAGLAAQKAWQILHFVQQGVTGNSNTIADTNGLLALYRGTDELSEATIHWDKDWAIDKPGLWFKLYPCCSANAHPIDATIDILEKHSIDVSQIESIRIYFPEKGDAALLYTSPTNGEEGRFSAEYCVANLLLGNELSIETFSLKKLEKEVVELMGKIVRVYDATIPVKEESFPKNRYSIVEIEMTNGQAFESRCDIPTGSPGKPLHTEDFITKAESLLKKDAEQFIQLFRNGNPVDIKDIITQV